MNCPKCSAIIYDGMKFCHECGEKVINYNKANESSGISLGDKNIISGEVIGHKSEIKVNGGSYTNTTVYNTDETKKVFKCYICNEFNTVLDSAECSCCTKWICRKHLDKEQDVCLKCAENNKTIYITKFSDVYNKGIITKDIRSELDKLASDLKLSNITKELEKNIFKEISINELDLIDIEKAIKLYYNEYAVVGAYKIIQSFEIQLKHYKNKFWSAYIDILIDYDVDEALKNLSELNFDDHDIVFKRFNSLLKVEDFRAARELLNRSDRILSDDEKHALRAELYIDYAFSKLDRSLLSLAEQELGLVATVDINYLILNSYFKYRKRKSEDLLNLLKNNSLNQFQLVHVRRLIDKSSNQILFLKLNNQEFRLYSGSIIGREGTVAVNLFERFSTVSRQHIQIQYRLGSWYIKTLSKTNPSFVDNIPYLNGEFILIKNEMKVLLSTQCLIQFIIKNVDLGLD